MSWFTGKQRSHSGGHKSTRIDPSTGQNKRVKVTVKPKRGAQPQRQNGKIVSGGRVEHRRAQKTGRLAKSRSWWS